MPAAGPQAHDVHVLLVEDEPGDAELALVALRAIRRPRHRATRVDRLAEAIAALAAESFDVVLLDLSLPDSRGFATTRAILDAAPETAIVVLTGLDDDAVASQALREGCQDYLTKGTVEPELIKRVIRFAIDRKRSENAIRESEERFQDYAEIGSDWFWEMGEDLCLTAIHGNLFEATGLDVADLIGKTHQDLMEAATPELDIAVHADDLRNQRPFRNLQFGIMRPDGALRYVRLSGRPRFRRGVFQGYRGVGSDVTQHCLMVEQIQRHAEEALASQHLMERQAAELASLAEEAQLQKERAELASHTKSQFLATMSHEIRTPMTGVLGMADLLLASPLTAEQRERLMTLKESGKTLLNLLNDILDISKIEAGKLEIEQADFLFRPVVESIATIFAERADERHNVIRVAVDPDIPPVILGDGHRLKQILYNFAGNAVKFTENGTISVEARIGERVDDVLVLRFDVRDTGIGIPLDVQGRLFASYAQGESSTARKFGGTGLGLAISKNLIELMGGEVGVISSPGEGSTFWFTIRCRQGLRTVAELVDAGPERIAVQAPTHPLRILVAEDNRVNQMLIGAMLGSLGSVHIVPNGLEAVKAVEAKDYDVIVMDVRMPEMDGVEATRRIRSMNSGKGGVPIIALSADMMLDHVQSYLAAGMNDAVSKPIDHQRLLETIWRWTGTNAAHLPAPVPPANGTPSPAGNDRREERVSEEMSAFLELLGVPAEEEG
ncbi:MAG: response regulator [Alphaproteobacteria bacterium]|nr:response regulator [Alphaproteobacteria bacterium]